MSSSNPGPGWLPIGKQPHAEQPVQPLPEGPNDLGRKNSTPL